MNNLLNIVSLTELEDRLITSVLKIPLLLWFLLIIFFLWQETYLFKRHVEVQNRKKYFYVRTSKHKCRFSREINTFPSISFIKGRVFSIFRQKMNKPNPSETDIKALIFALTYYLLLQATP